MLELDAELPLAGRRTRPPARALPPEGARRDGPDGAAARARRRRRGGRLGMLRDGRALRVREGPLRGLDEDGGAKVVSGGAGGGGAGRRRAGDQLPGADPGRNRTPGPAPRRVPGLAPGRPELADRGAVVRLRGATGCSCSRRGQSACRLLVVRKNSTSTSRSGGRSGTSAGALAGPSRRRDAGPPEGMVFRDLRSFFFGVDEDFFRMAGRAKQIVGWHATHRFCGRCGGEDGAGARGAREEVYAVRDDALPAPQPGGHRPRREGGSDTAGAFARVPEGALQRARGLRRAGRVDRGDRRPRGKGGGGDRGRERRPTSGASRGRSRTRS